MIRAWDQGVVKEATESAASPETPRALASGKLASSTLRTNGNANLIKQLDGLINESKRRIWILRWRQTFSACILWKMQSSIWVHQYNSHITKISGSQSLAFSNTQSLERSFCAKAAVV